MNPQNPQNPQNTAKAQSSNLQNDPAQSALNPNPQGLDPNDPNVAKDPVCGTLVDKRTAPDTLPAAVNDPSQGTLYFCSADCKAQFEADPQRYGYQNF